MVRDKEIKNKTGRGDIVRYRDEEIESKEIRS